MSSPMSVSDIPFVYDIIVIIKGVYGFSDTFEIGF